MCSELSERLCKCPPNITKDKFITAGMCNLSNKVQRHKKDAGHTDGFVVMMFYLINAEKPLYAMKTSSLAVSS